MHLSVKQQLAFLLISVIFAALGIAAFIIVPAFRDITELERSINQTQKFLEKQYERTQRLRRSANAITNVVATTDKFKQSLVYRGDELLLIQTLEDTAAAHHIDQTLVVDFVTEAQTKKQAGAASKIERPYYIFSFLNHGAFANHVQYLKALEQLPYYLMIDSLAWEKSTKASEDYGFITLRFDARIYVSDNE